ncbi:MAG: alpha-glucan family phosphorylase, partial [Candidatus Thermoplasmatota archaeon]|nr:alpha-glucan family phosphorylase [Candidatus Thermoplasmatota archaeon]
MPVVGYFTAEIGLWSELHTYSGGLGVLAGDHVKSAADAGIPLVGVTLLYHQGYARQHIDNNGIQTETFPEFDVNKHLTKTDMTITLALDGQSLSAHVWKAEIVGQSGHVVPVYFIDTRHESNISEHQSLSSRLYGGDDDMRIRQEYVLGVGGVQLFDHLGVEMQGLHLNEGHCTFAMLELLNRGWSREELAKRSLFTTHTPVPAGHDRFDWSLVEQVVGDILPKDARTLVRNAGDSERGARCSMSHLAVALSTSVNAVSKLNANVAMTMFDEQVIRPITNGVHHITWTSPVMASYFDQHLNGWRTQPESIANAETLPTEELNQARATSRAQLRDYVLSTTGVELSPDRLTIGFARRFA